MSQKQVKSQSFLQGAGILAIATILVKVIGALYKIPLNNILGKEGFGIFNQAYEIYSWLLVISTAGLPVAMSRMIAAARSRENPAQIHRIYNAALYVFLTIGVVGCVGMMAFSRQLAILMGYEGAASSIFALGPAVLFVCLNSAYRGYFQGQSNMTPTGVSQVIEALCKLIVGIALAQMVLNATSDIPKTTAAAIWGVTIGSVLAFCYLAVVYRRNAAALLSGDHSKPDCSLKRTAKELLAIAIPITIGSAGLQTISVIDTAMVLRRLTGAAGIAENVAIGLRGIYASAQTLFNLPGALVLPFSISVIPAITAAMTKKDRKGALRLENSAIRIMTLLILPCGVGLGVLSKPIMTLLYSSSYTEADLAIGAVLLTTLSIAVIFNGLVLLLNAILQAHGFVSLPVLNMLIGGVLKVVINYILVGNPDINIYGAPIGTTVCFIVITLLDVFCLKRVLPHPPKLLRLMGKPVLASALMGAAAYGTYLLLAGFSQKIACVLAILAAVAVYAAAVYFLKIITKSDCALLPKGDKIAKLLKIG